ncbi:MAG: alpha/beta hydrolase [Planctomycetaceae bacterium]|nr:alpha/beta hydrolase [Planctomycetaceae bacterium]
MKRAFAVLACLVVPGTVLSWFDVAWFDVAGFDVAGFDGSGIAAQAQDRPLDVLAQSLRPDRLLTYKTVAGRDLKLHVFEPEGHKCSDRRSVFLIIHGGGWTGGYPWRCYPFADEFRRLGMVAITIDYRLLNQPPGTTVLDCVRDGRSAVRAVRSHAADLGIDPHRVVVAGCSAGGHVAAGTFLFTDVDDPADDTGISCVPDAVVLYYPVIDTSADGYGQKKIGEDWMQLSPVDRVRPGLPPTLVFHGTADTVTPFAGVQRFHQRMLSAGNECELVAHEGGRHGWFIFDLQQFREVMSQTKRFLVQRTFVSGQTSDN